LCCGIQHLPKFGYLGVNVFLLGFKAVYGCGEDFVGEFGCGHVSV